MPWALGIAASTAVGGPVGLLAGIGAAFGADALINADVYREHLARGAFIEQSSGRYIRPGVSNDVDSKGFSRSEIGELTRFIEETGRGERFFTGDEIDELTKEFTFSGVFDSTRSVDEFKRKFNEAKENLKLIMQEMGTSIEEGTGLMRDLSAVGYGPQDIKGVVQSAKMAAGYSGISSRAAMNTILSGGAQIFQGTGFDMSMGSNMMALNISRVGLMDMHGGIDPETLRQMGGTEGAATALTSIQGGMLQSRPVRTVLQAAFRGTGQVDMDVIGRALSGELSNFQVNRLARSTLLGDRTNRLAFVGQYDELVENLPTPVAQALAAYPLIQRAQNIKRNHPDMEITPDMLKGIAIQDLGMGRNEADLLVSSVTNLNIDEIIASGMGKSQLAGDRVPYSGYSWLHPLDSTALFSKRLYNEYIADPFVEFMDETQESIHRGLQSTQGIETFEGRTLVPLSVREKIEADLTVGTDTIDASGLSSLIRTIGPDDQQRRGLRGTIAAEDAQGADVFFDTGDAVRAMAEGDRLFNKLSTGNFEQFRQDLDGAKIKDLTDQFKGRIDPSMSPAEKKIELFRFARDENLGAESPKELLALQDIANAADPNLLKEEGEFSGALTPDLWMTSSEMQRSMERIGETREKLTGMTNETLTRNTFTEEAIESARTISRDTQGMYKLRDETGPITLRADVAMEHRARNAALVDQIAAEDYRGLLGDKYIPKDMDIDDIQSSVEQEISGSARPDDPVDQVISMLNVFNREEIDLSSRAGAAAFRKVAQDMNIDIGGYLNRQRELVSEEQRPIFNQMIEENRNIIREQDELTTSGPLQSMAGRLEGVRDITDDMLPGMLTYTETEALRDAIDRKEIKFADEDVFRGREQDVESGFTIVERYAGGTGQQANLRRVFAVRTEKLQEEIRDRNTMGSRMMGYWQDVTRSPEDRQEARREGLMGALGVLREFDEDNEEAIDAFDAYVNNPTEDTREALRTAMEDRIGDQQAQEFMDAIGTDPDSEGMEIFKPLANAAGRHRQVQRNIADDAAKKIDSLRMREEDIDEGAINRVTLSGALDILEREPDRASLDQVLVGVVKSSPEMFGTTRAVLDQMDSSDIMDMLAKDPDMERQAMELFYSSARAQGPEMMQRAGHLMGNMVKYGLNISDQRQLESIEETRQEAVEKAAAESGMKTGFLGKYGKTIGSFFRGDAMGAAHAIANIEERGEERIEALYNLSNLQARGGEAYTKAVAQFRVDFPELARQLTTYEEGHPMQGQIDFSRWDFSGIAQQDYIRENVFQRAALRGKATSASLIESLRKDLVITDAEREQLIPTQGLSDEEIKEKRQDFINKVSTELQQFTAAEIGLLLTPDDQLTDDKKEEKKDIAEKVEAFGREREIKTDVRAKANQGESADQAQGELINVLWALKATLDSLGPNLRSSNSYWTRGGR